MRRRPLKSDASTFDTTPCDFSLLFPTTDNGSQTYVNRYRPGAQSCSRKTRRGSRSSTLEVQFGQTLDAPGPVDSLGVASDWKTITHGWKPLTDRLGIEVDCENPNAWATGNPKIFGGDIRESPGKHCRRTTPKSSYSATQR